jgi:hypothetical protein
VLSVPMNLYQAEPVAPVAAPVAINPDAAAKEANLLKSAIALPIVDAHTHIQGMSLQDTSSDPYARPKWIRRNMRSGSREVSMLFSGDLAFVQYSATNDEAVANMGLNQLNYFAKQHKAKIFRPESEVADHVMVTLGMDFGFTPLMCGRGMQAGGGAMTGARIRKRKETSRHYFVNDTPKKLVFKGEAAPSITGPWVTAMDGVWKTVKDFTWVKSTPGGNVVAKYAVKYKGHDCFTASAMNDNSVVFEAVSRPGPAFELIDGMRKALGRANFVVKIGTKTFSPKVSISHVPSEPYNLDYYEDQKVPPEVLDTAWVRIIDAPIYSTGGEAPEAFYYLNQKDQNFKNTIEAMWRVASFKCGRIWPLCPYDPRRANALDFVKTAIDEKAHIGVKTYTRTFWMPTGNAAMYGKEMGKVLDDRNDELYKYLLEKDLPLLNHTSPTGWPAWPVYPEPFTSDKTDKLVPPHPYLDDAKKGKAPASNDNPYRISWQEVGSCWRKSEDKEGHPQYAQYEELEGVADTFIQTQGKDRFQALFCAVILRAAARIAHYNLYVQLCVSPGAWKPVLAKYPNLRINLAHAGSKLSPYFHYQIKTSEKAEDAIQGKKPEVNAMVAPKVKTPSSGGRGGFKDTFIAGVATAASEELYDGFGPIHPGPEGILALTKEILGTKPWTAWFAAWHEKFGDKGWWGDLMDILKTYKNVYSDFSYYTEGKDDMINVLEPIIQEVVHGGEHGKTILEKTMLGSDWYMTQADALSSEEYWKLFYAAMDNHWKTKKGDLAGDSWQQNAKYKELWTRWVTMNALRCYNLREEGMKRMEDGYKGFRKFLKDREGWTAWYTIEQDIENGKGDAWIRSLPKWWKELKKFYKDQQ